MAAVLNMNYSSRDSFHGYPHHYTPDKDRSRQFHGAYASDHYAFARHQRERSQPQPQPNSYQFSSSPSSEDGFKPSLPSISNLLTIANSDRATKDAEPLEAPVQRQSGQHPARTVQRQPQGHINFQPTHMNATAGMQPSYHRQERSDSRKILIPPTPPFRGDAVLEGTQSPSTISSGSSLSTVQTYFLGSALNSVEASDQRPPPEQPTKRQPVPSHTNMSTYRTSPYSTSPYASSPMAPSSRPQYSPVDPSYQGTGMYQQRSLPSNFPPPPPIPADTRPALPTANPWEHHHYISSSSQASFPPPQDRYVCPTCSKAFSRPSSLKIHSHSHTGEKPFKCPHGGCGKAFSVRSNMKRHERGCHARQPGFFSSPPTM